MTLRALKLENYKQYTQLELDFRDGLVGIIGKNGAGKSTLFEAILYSLYGRDEINPKELIRAAAAPDRAPVKLWLDFAVGDTVYSVRRELRGRKLETAVAELYRNDELMAKGAQAVTGEVERLLNLDRESFKHSVFSGQKELSELSETKGRERTRLVRRMLGLERLDELQNAVNTDRNNLKNQISGQEKLLLSEVEQQQMQAESDALQRTLETVEHALAGENERKAALEKQTGEAKTRFEKEAARQTQYRELDRQSAELRERAANLSAEKQKQEAKKQSLSAIRRQVAENAKLFEQVPALQMQLQALEKMREKKLNADARTTELAELEQQIDVQKQRLQALENDLHSVRKALSGLEEAEQQLKFLDQAIEQKREVYNSVKVSISTLEEKVQEQQGKVKALESIGREGACPTCFQPLRDAYDQVLSALLSELERWNTQEKVALTSRLKQAEEDGRQLRREQQAQSDHLKTLYAEKARLPELEKQLRHEQNALAQTQARRTSTTAILEQIGEVAFEDARFAQIQAELSRLEPVYEQLKQEKNYADREWPLCEQAIADAGRQMELTAAGQKQLLAQQEALGFDPKQYEEAFRAFRDMDTHLNEQFKRIEQLLGEKQRVQQQFTRLRERLDQHNHILQQIEAQQIDLDILEKLSELFRQFKTDVLERVSPGISHYAGALFSRITKGKYESIRVDEHFEFSIADGGIFYPIERFSGGEIDLANFCLRIAITRSIMELNGNGQSVEFLAFDEIFGSQDEERRHEMMLALNHLQEQFRQIYIISHIESQKDYYPNILEVRTAPEGSVAEWNN